MLPVQQHNTNSSTLEYRDFNITSGSFKPVGAFWTSTYIDNSSAWLDWCDYEQPDWIKPYNFLLTVDPYAKVYVIDTLADLERLIARYPYTPLRDTFLVYVDWAAMANDYDGIQVTESGQWATRLTTPGLYGWDCESTAWFRWVFTHVERI